jgi:hypothetical protein
MGNPIKYSATVTSGSYNKGNVAIGTNTISFGPTSTTGWYNSVTPTGGNFIVMEVVDGNTPPRFYAPSTEAEWIRLAKQEGATGSNTGSAAAVRSWFASQANFVVTNIDFPANMPSVVGNGQVTYLDSEFASSYPGSGTAWNDISGLGNNTTLVNGPTFNSEGKYIQFDGIDDYTSIPNPGDTGSIQFSWYWPGTAQSFIAGNLAGYAMLYNGGNGTVMHWYPANGGYDFGGSLPSREGWYNITLTWGGNYDNKMYINGALVMSSTAYFISKPPIWYFAAGGSYTAQAIRLQTIQAYNKILTQTEILQNHHKASIVTDGLVLALDAGNIISYVSGSTTAYNLSGSSASTSGGTLSVDFNGTLTNGTGYDSGNGGSWNFDGTNDYIEIPFETILNDCSFEMWFKATSTKIYQYPLSIRNNNVGNSYAFFLDMNDQDGSGFAQTMWAYWNSGGSPNSVVPKTGTFGDWNDSTWRHYVFTRSTTVAPYTLHYMNGNLVGNISRNGEQTTQFGNGAGYKLYLGSYAGITLNFPGYEAVVRIYNKVLSAAEVSQNFNAQRSRFGI